MTMLRDINRVVNGRLDSTDPRVGVLASEIPTGFDVPSFLLNDIDTAYPNRLYSVEVLTLPAAGTLYLEKDGSGTFEGAPVGDYSGTQLVRKYDPGVGLVSDVTGDYTISVLGEVVRDTTPPVFLGPLSITDIKDSGFTVNWEPATDNLEVVDYQVSIDTGTPAYYYVGNVDSYIATGLVGNTAYTVRVKSMDAAGNFSDVLTTTASTLAPIQNDVLAPVIPGTLEVSLIGVDRFTVAWLAASDNIGVTGYEISVDTGTAAYTDCGLVLLANPTNLTPSSTYTVRVRAYDAAGNRSTALTTQVTTATPIDLTSPVWASGSVITVSSITSSSLTATWPSATDNVGIVSYEVSVDTGAAEYNSVGTLRTKVATQLVAGTTYNVRVRAVDAAGNKSIPITATAVTSGVTPVGEPIKLVSKLKEAPATIPLAVLSSQATSLVFKAGAGQELVLFNNSGLEVTANLRGSKAGAVTTKGLAGVTIDLSGGLPIKVPAHQFVTLKLDNASAYLAGNVSLTADVGGVLYAGLLVQELLA